MASREQISHRRAPEGIPEKRRVRDAFARAAAQYDAAAVLQREVGRRLFERLSYIRLRPGRVLDAGCGTGAQSVQLLAHYGGCEVVALDLALPMARRAARRRHYWRRPRAVCADLHRLPLADGSVDLVFSNLALQWSGSPETVLAEFLRVLRPGGFVLFSTFGTDTLKELREAWLRADPAHTHVNAFVDLHDLGDLLLATGFSDPVTDAERIVMTYPTLSGLMGDLKAIGAQNHTQGRPRTLTGKGRVQALERAYEQFRREDGRLPATFEVVYGMGWKLGRQIRVQRVALGPQ